MRLVMVRHGEAEKGDDPGLTERGAFEASRVRHVIGDPKRIITSTMRRAYETAELLTDDAIVLLADRYDELREKQGGLTRGLSHTELEERFPWIVEAWKRGEDPRPPGGESMADVEARAMPVVRAALEEYGDIVLVGHKSLNTAIIGALLHVPAENRWRLLMDHAHVTVLRSERDEFRLSAFNVPPVPVPRWYDRSAGFAIGSRRSERGIALTLAKHPEAYGFLQGLIDVLNVEGELEDRAAYVTRCDDLEIFEGDLRVVIVIGTSRLFVSIDGSNEALDRYLIDRLRFIEPQV